MGALVIGTLVWLVLALAIGGYIIYYVGKSSALGKENENKKIAMVAVTIGSLSMWLMWITCYMHQMHPLIKPKIQF